MPEQTALSKQRRKRLGLTLGILVFGAAVLWVVPFARFQQIRSLPPATETTRVILYTQRDTNGYSVEELTPEQKQQLVSLIQENVRFVAPLPVSRQDNRQYGDGYCFVQMIWTSPAGVTALRLDVQTLPSVRGIATYTVDGKDLCCIVSGAGAVADYISNLTDGSRPAG